MCRLLNISSSGYYRWRQRVVSQREIANRKLFEHIYRVFHENRQAYGPIREWKTLKKEGIECGRDRVTRLMKVNKLRCNKQKGRIVTTKSDPSKKPVPNFLDQIFEAEAPNQKWSSDITHIRTGEGWLFLVIILDLFSRKIVGWAMDATMTANLDCRAYQTAYQQGRPKAQPIHHSDRVSQYTSHDFRQLWKNQSENLANNSLHSFQ